MVKGSHGAGLLNLANRGQTISESLWAEIAEVLKGRIGYDPAMICIDTKPNCTSLNVAKM